MSKSRQEGRLKKNNKTDLHYQEYQILELLDKLCYIIMYECIKKNIK